MPSMAVYNYSPCDSWWVTNNRKQLTLETNDRSDCQSINQSIFITIIIIQRSWSCELCRRSLHHADSKLRRETLMDRKSKIRG